MIDDQELISGLNSAIERLLGGDPAVAVEEDVDIEVRPYVEIFALLLEDVRAGARPEFRASLRERFVTGAGTSSRPHAGALGRVAGFAAATFILGSAVNPVLARSLMASISETMGGEVAGAVGRILDLAPADDVASPEQLTPGSRAAGSTAQLAISPEVPAFLLPPADGAAVTETPDPSSLPPGLTGQHPVQHPAPAGGDVPVPPAAAATPPSTAGGRPANTPAAGSAPVIDPPIIDGPVAPPPPQTLPSAGDPPATTPPGTAESPPTTTTTDPAGVDPAVPGSGNGTGNGPNGGNGNPSVNGNPGPNGNSGPQQGQPGTNPSKRADAVQAAGAGNEISSLGNPENAPAGQGGPHGNPGASKVKANQGNP